ncbi:MAG: hypothetical protein E6G56_07585 [Actinobacteria bacterium]|nr:MAG: hypothetical protein E6G56_07585 [Actinomycetota bacterium]
MKVRLLVAVGYAVACALTAIAWPYALIGGSGITTDVVAAAVIVAHIGVGWFLIGPRVLAVFVIAALVGPGARVDDPCMIVGYHTDFQCTSAIYALAASFVLPVATLTIFAGELVPRIRQRGRPSLMKGRRAILASAALILLGALFLPWYSGVEDSGPYSTSGWNAFDELNVGFAAVAVAVLISTVAQVRVVDAGVRVLAAAAAGICFYRIFTPADGDFALGNPAAGPFVALAALLVSSLMLQAHRNAGRPARDVRRASRHALAAD